MAGAAIGQEDIVLIPAPLSCERLPGSFAIAEDTPIYSADPAADALLREALRLWAPASGPNEGSVRMTHGPVVGAGVEAYQLTIQPDRVLIEATGTPGMLQGVQRLRQLLLDGPELPCLRIVDAPRLSWRGAHVDVARHMPPAAWLQRFVDLIALHGYNSLHLHLTDDQGWRMPVDRYPLLTEIGGFRPRTQLSANPGTFEETRYGGSYTKAELTGLVAFAESRGVGIIPEIEMPGHVSAAIAAYPMLGTKGSAIEVSGRWGIHDDILNVEGGTIRFIHDVLEEVMEIFPSPFIHAGGDEVPTAQWEAIPSAKARIASEGLRDASKLYGWFLRQISNWLRQRDRIMAVWDEALRAGLPGESTLVMAWRGEDQGRAAAVGGHPVVMAPRQFTYFDYYQSKDRDKEPLAIGGHLPLERVYGFEPVSPTLNMADQRRILGTQFQLWSEFIRTPEQFEYMAFPRACALAEVAWTPPKLKDYADFRRRLEVHAKRLERLRVNFRPLDPA
ncbi:MAG: beta-N-acetylhexosaminidase [Dehalococcoidia bacterium]